MTMPAVVLVGGEGTRLRPLTNTTPKPMLPLFGQPLLAYAFDHLSSIGVSRIVLACGYLPDAIVDHFGSAVGETPLECTVEPQPLGTGGAIRFAAEGFEQRFLALNGDSLREADLDALVRFHLERGAAATILLTRVQDPSRYGLVTTDGDGRVTGFIEKPAPEQIVTDQINAGLYILEPEVLDLIEPGRIVSIERDVFPQLAAAGVLYGLALPGYWLDVGTPESFLQAHFDLLGAGGDVTVHRLARVSGDAELRPPVVVGPHASVAAGARLGPFVHVDRGASISSGAHVVRTAVLPRAVIDVDARVEGAIVAPGIGTIRA
jgi:mannose-1-phosphate guanylyltransferase